mmetsp:Transcript_52651/g.170005  ORF Transcript_52651/g.170005 Transcript_52651/m.170005 type:complete len:156 (+) Transcript_52651:1049-1516(+)
MGRVLCEMVPPIAKCIHGRFEIMPGQESRMWRVDEEGLTTEGVTQVRVVTTAADKMPSMSGHHSISHITVLPFHSAAGSTTRRQAVVHSGSWLAPKTVLARLLSLCSSSKRFSLIISGVLTAAFRQMMRSLFSLTAAAGTISRCTSRGNSFGSAG